jgi:hypothetical protein
MAGCAFGFLRDKQITKKAKTPNPDYRSFLNMPHGFFFFYYPLIQAFLFREYRH